MPAADFQQIDDLVGAGVGNRNQLRLPGCFEIVNLTRQGDGAVDILDLDRGFREERCSLFWSIATGVAISMFIICVLPVSSQMINWVEPDFLAGQKQIVGPEGDHIRDVRSQNIRLGHPGVEVHLLRLARLKNDRRNRRIVRASCPKEPSLASASARTPLVAGHASAHSDSAVPIATPDLRPILNSFFFDILILPCSLPFLAKQIFPSYLIVLLIIVVAELLVTVVQRELHFLSRTRRE